MQAHVAGLVDAVDVAKGGGDGEVGRDLGQGRVDVVDVLGLGVERVVVDVLVVDPVLFAAGDADLLWRHITPRQPIPCHQFSGSALDSPSQATASSAPPSSGTLPYP